MTDKIVLRTVPVIRVVRMGGGAGGGGAGGGGAWGSITGTLSAQTDLQTALDAKQASDAELTALAGLASAADRLPYFTGGGTAALATFTAFGRSLVDDADASAARTTLGLGTAAVAAAGDFDPVGAAAAAQAASQPLDGDLTAIAALSATGGWAKRTAANTWIISTPTASEVGADTAGSAAAAESNAKAYADGLVVGLVDDRGNHDASGNVFPSTGGSGAAGAVLKGDLWTISVQGALGGTTVYVGSSIRALVDAPGQVAANWGLIQQDLGYVPVPTSRTVNGHALTSDVTITAGDVGAPSGSGNSTGTNTGDQTLPTGANPSASVGMSPVNGTAATWMRSDAAPAISAAIAPTWTGVHTFQQAVAATSTDGVVLETSATATSGNQKRSPRLRLRGQVFETSGGSSQPVDWTAEVLPLQGATAKSLLQFRAYLNNVAQNPVLVLGAYGAYGGFIGGMVVSGTADDPYTGSYMTFDTAGISVKRSSAIGFTASTANGNGNQRTAITCPADYGFRFGGGYSALTANPPNAITYLHQDASGTNIAGATPAKYIASLATGNAASGGWEWHTGDPGASGTTLQTATKKMGLDGTGKFDLTNTTEATSSTAAASKTAGGFAAAKKIIAGGQIRPGTFTVATLPAGANGDMAYATDGRKVGEGAGVGTGTHVLYSNGQWRLPEDQSVVAA